MNNEQNNLNPKNVLIVGGTGGIGNGFVQHFLTQPEVATVFATYRPGTIEHPLFELQRDRPEKLQLLPLDVTDAQSYDHLIAKIKQITPHLHLALYCVGLLHDQTLAPEKSLAQINPENLLKSFQVNSLGGILLAKSVLPLLRHPERNILAFISAKVGSIEDNRLGGWYGYRASKAALNMFIKTAAIEYSRKSKQTIVVSLHPGTTDTKLSKPFQQNVRPEKLFPVERTVRQLVQVLESLEYKDNGKFFCWDGSILPW